MTWDPKADKKTEKGVNKKRKVKENNKKKRLTDGWLRKSTFLQYRNKIKSSLQRKEKMTKLKKNI